MHSASGLACCRLLWDEYAAAADAALTKIGLSKWWVTGRAPDGSEKHYLLRAPQPDEDN